MDKIVLFIILLGIFLGLINSLTMITREDHLSPLFGGQVDTSLSEKVAMLNDSELEALETLEAPGRELAAADLGYPSTLNAETEDWRQASKGDDEEVVVAPFEANASHFEIDEEGVTATYPEAKMRYLYSNYGMAVVRFKDSEDVSGLRATLGEIGAVIVDEMKEIIFILLPTDAVDRLNSLIDEGFISSFDLGGWGLGIGKA